VNGIYWKGKIRKPSEVKLSPVNTGLLYGESLFEAVPVYDGKPLYFREHMQRLNKGCHFLGWPLPSEKEFHKAIRLFSEMPGAKGDFLIRFNLVQEILGPAHPKAFYRNPPALFAMIRPLRHDPSSMEPPQGKVGLSPWRAADPRTFPNYFKAAAYLTTRQVFRKHPEWDDILRLNEHGQVVDGGSSTPLWFDGSKVCASPLGLGGLESVTRIKVLEYVRKMGIGVIEKPWKPIDALKKGELFMVGSGVGVMAVSELQGRRLRNCGIFALRVWENYRKHALKIR
jgi:branched-subunit amino acid aminotransferase/4-amino-4-deoxychorismate lyase